MTRQRLRPATIAHAICLLMLSIQPLFAEQTTIISPVMNFKTAYEQFSAHGQKHLFDDWQALTAEQQENLLTSLSAIDLPTLAAQQEYLKDVRPQEKSDKSFAPFNEYVSSGSPSLQLLGRELVANGKVGCLLVAGGQGSRLGYALPKGTYPISPIKEKSLFQLVAEKVAAASLQAGRLLPLAIMTSPENHSATVSFFQTHNLFGLDPAQIDFFTQAELPFLDDNGLLMRHPNGAIVKGPDGNGCSLKAFADSGIAAKWQQIGISIVNYILVDNPLADPFDFELAAFHHAEKCQVTIKCIERNSPQESVGMLVANDDGLGCQIVEYSEMSDSERQVTADDGQLKHRLANISLFTFDIDFLINDAYSEPLPWHLAHKASYPTGPKGWKFETFIFDLLPRASKVKAVLYPRSQTFAPLKNSTGADSPESVKQALVLRDRQILEAICGSPVGEETIELSPQFYYPTTQLLSSWKGKMGPFEGFIGSN